jgi:type III secretion YscU/HrpY family protein
MAENKTEQPTQKKLREARKKGQVSKSTDLTNAFLFLTAAATLAFAGPPLVGQIRGFLIQSFQPDLMAGNLGAQPLLDRTGYAFAKCLLYVAPFLGAVFLVSAAVNMAQVKPMLSVEVVQPKFDKLNPVNGFKNLFFKPKTYLELLKNVIKFAVIFGIGYYSIRADLASIVLCTGDRPDQLGTLTAELFFHLFYRVGAAFLVIGAADFMLQRKLFMKEMMMSKEEVKKEYKEEEGDPHIKHARRRLHHELLAEASMTNVRKADVIVVNPTHLAIALEYQEEVMNAPRVAAKGQELRAERIIQIARENNIPIMRNEPLAHTLFEIEIGEEIPEALYEAVAEVLNWLYQLRQEQSP